MDAPGVVDLNGLRLLVHILVDVVVVASSFFCGVGGRDCADQLFITEAGVKPRLRAVA